MWAGTAASPGPGESLGTACGVVVSEGDADVRSAVGAGAGVGGAPADDVTAGPVGMEFGMLGEGTGEDAVGAQTPDGEGGGPPEPLAGM